MLKNHPFPVNEENFSRCWEYVDRQRRTARVKAAIAKHGGFLSNQFFLLALLYLANGLAVTHMTGSYCRFLKSLPGFLAPWEKLAEHLLKPGASWQENAVKLILLTYLASIILFALICAVISLVYHPRKKAVPTLSYGENANLLVKQAQEARDFSYQTRIVTSRVAMVFTIVCGLALFFAYALYLKNPNKVVSLLRSFPTDNETTNALLYVLAAYFAIDWLTAPFLWVTRIFYRFDFPYDLVVQAEAAALIARDGLTDLSPEALAEKAAALREEALELEKQNGYHPAKEKLHQAALLGDVSAMEHYARHCLLLHMNDSARYWLNKCAASENASKEALRMRRRMQLRMRHDVEYLRPEGNLTRKQRRLKALGSFAIKLLSLIMVLLLTAAVAWGAAMYFAPEGTEVSLTEFFQGLADQLPTGKP